MDEAIKVLLVDDQDLVRYGFRLVLDAEDDLRIVAEAANGVEAVEEAARTRPDVVIMDVRMPRCGGIDATKLILENAPETRVLMLTTWDLDEYAFGALQAGAAGFLLKDARPFELVEAVRTVHRGDSIVSPRITSRLIEVAVPHLGARRVPESLSVLSSREREVFVLVGRGLTNAEIAVALSLSESTVKAHFGRVLDKLGLLNRVQAVICAYESGAVASSGDWAPGE